MPLFDADHIRHRLANLDALPLLSLLGIIAGISSGLVIVLFRFIVEIAAFWWIEEPHSDFEQLSPMVRALLPVGGALVLGIWYHRIPVDLRRHGVAYVIERYNLNQGFISLKSLVNQFAGAAISLMSGHSMGREGPAVHLGAATSSLLGKWAGLPNNSVRILVGCGCAAAIAASFNTPIAGVIFAMEVVMLEYSIITFTPIILASVVGASLTRAFYGHELAFDVPPLTLNSLLELPFIVFCGLAIGCFAAAFTYLTTQINIRSQSIPIWQRFGIAGVITGLLGALFPEILGIGYDTVNQALMGKLALTAMISIAVVKLLASSICAGSGLPAGIIGPCMMMGAMTGGALGAISNVLFPGFGASAGFYSMLGMAAMMSAALQAPLAALMALLELTANPNIIFPGMLVVVLASLVCSEVFKQKSIFISLLEAQGIDLQLSALSNHLNRIAVPAVMERRFKRVSSPITHEDAQAVIADNPVWLLLEKDDKPTQIMHAAALANYLQEQQNSTDQPEGPPSSINLFEIPGKRDNITAVLMSATLKEALDAMNRSHSDAVYVHRMNAPGIYRIYGVITRSDIEQFYQS